MDLDEFERLLHEFVEKRTEKFLQLLKHPKVRDELMKELEFRTGRRDLLKLGILGLLGLSAVGTADGRVVIGGDFVSVDGHRLLTWDDVRSKLEMVGALNKQYDKDCDGFVEKIVAEEVASLPSPGKRGRLVVHNGKLWYDDGEKWI